MNDYQMKHTDYSAIARHDYKDIPISGFPVESRSRMIDNTRLCLQMHIGEITDNNKMIQTGNILSITPPVSLPYEQIRVA